MGIKSSVFVIFVVVSIPAIIGKSVTTLGKLKCDMKAYTHFI